MSIYATIEGIGDIAFGDDEEIGQPYLYEASHILPAEDSPRGGIIGLALIPSHITRDGRDDQPQGGTPWPWLRLYIDVPGDDPCVLLTPAQARYLADQLTAWAHRAEPADSTRPTASTITDDALDALHERLAKAENAIAQIRRLCQMTIDVSVRAHAIQQAHDTLALIDAPSGPAATEATQYAKEP